MNNLRSVPTKKYFLYLKSIGRLKQKSSLLDSPPGFDTTVVTDVADAIDELRCCCSRVPVNRWLSSSVVPEPDESIWNVEQN